MSVLALESDPQQGAAIRHIVNDLVRARLTLVSSVEQAVQALRTEMPYVVLLPALLSQADEAEIVASLSALPDGARVELLITPLLYPRKEPAPSASPWWRQWAPSAQPPPGNTHARELQQFAERLAWSLESARERQAPAEDPLVEAVEAVKAVKAVEPVEPVESFAARADEDAPAHPPAPVVLPPPVPTSEDAWERRAHRRFLARDLPGLRAARINTGPSVSLVDVSAGGALVETEAPLRPNSESVLELLGGPENTLVRFRVVRCQVARIDGAIRYFGACAFMQPFNLDELLLPGPATSSATPEGQADASRPVRPAERRRHTRVNGPFEGRRLGALDMPIQIRDLSEGGCFVFSLLETPPAGRRLKLQVAADVDDWITVDGEVVHTLPGFGYAVRFVECSDATRAWLLRIVASRTGSVADDDAIEPAASASLLAANSQSESPDASGTCQLPR